jgi:hypothetical protein
MPQNLVDNTYNRAYAKFVNSLTSLQDPLTPRKPGEYTEGVTADIATNLAEHHQANAMITKRLVQLAKFAVALRRFRWNDAADALGVTRPGRVNNLKRDAKSLGNNWLEFHFGWAPLIGDIKSSMDILTGGLPPFRIRSKAQKAEIAGTYVPSSNHLLMTNTRYESGWLIEAYISVSNPNIWLANRLGMLNPLGLAWELVPFSFIADWFVNLNDVLKSSSEFYGLSLINPFRTEFRHITHEHTEIWNAHWDGGWNIPFRRLVWASEFCNVGRTVGPIPGPVLRVRPAKALSWQRGLTAISLLLQAL